MSSYLAEHYQYNNDVIFTPPSLKSSNSLEIMKTNCSQFFHNKTIIADLFEARNESKDPTLLDLDTDNLLHNQTSGFSTEVTSTEGKKLSCKPAAASVVL